MRLIIFLLSFVFFSINSFAAKPTTIEFWHSFSGPLGEHLQSLCQEFNQSQTRYHIHPTYRGNYDEALIAFISAFHAHRQPPLVQIFEVGTATMLYPAGVIKPVYQLIKQHSATLSITDFLPAIRAYYGNEHGQLLAMPLGSSTAILYFNKTLFAKAGIKQPPKTWEEITEIAKKLKQVGGKCAITSAYPSWVHVESFTAMHGLPFVHGQHNKVLSAEIRLRSKALATHLALLQQWQQQGVFQYGGRESNAVSLFTSGRCAMLTQSSGSYGGLQTIAPFKIGVSALPYSPRLINKKGNTVVGGSALWVIEGFDDKTYQGIAEFMSYLSKPEVQLAWLEKTGYMPITYSAIKWSAKSKLNEASKIAYKQVLVSNQQAAGERLGFYPQIRMTNDEMMESILSGNNAIAKALLLAEEKSNYYLRRFSSNNYR